MGVAPEATVEYLYLAVGSTFISIKQPYIFVLHTILLSEVIIQLRIRVAPEHLNKYLYLIKGSRSYLIGILDSSSAVILKYLFEIFQ